MRAKGWPHFSPQTPEFDRALDRGVEDQPLRVRQK